jgi:hypothetical protein
LERIDVNRMYLLLFSMVITRSASHMFAKPHRFAPKARVTPSVSSHLVSHEYVVHVS